ncbi:MAG: uroporphyrinogen-III synthase [Epsilonproteobacteria bacterium]|nr:uroporphyrinogen-III synthase [Campylobacterota bacterium]
MIYLFSSSKYDSVVNMPLIEFEILKRNVDLAGYDMLLFTSKNAVTILDKINEKWQDMPSIAIGEESAKAIVKLGGKVALASSGYSKNLADDIKEKFADNKILYIRPKVVATNHINNLIKTGVALDEVVLYETMCKKYDILQKPPLDSTLIFTSPSTINCFIDNFGFPNGYKIVAIGETTAKALPRDVKYVMPKTPNIKECIKLAFSL